MSHSPIAAARRTIDQCCGQCGSAAGYECTNMVGQPISYPEYRHWHYIEPAPPPEPTDLEKRLANTQATTNRARELLEALK